MSTECTHTLRMPNNNILTTDINYNTVITNSYVDIYINCLGNEML